MFKRIVISGIMLLSIGIFCISDKNVKAGTVVQKKPAILFEGVINTIDYQFVHNLYNKGYNVEITNQIPSWPTLKKYNVVVVYGLGMSNADFTLTQTNKQNIKALKRFLSAGGGILFIPSLGEMPVTIPPQEAFGKYMGLNLLFKDVVFDKDAKTATAWNIPFGYTNNIINSPITEKVNGLWYPTTSIGGVYSLITFTLNNNWKIVIKGSKTSYTKKFPLEQLIGGKPGYYSRSVPLVAYRKFGKGRLVVISIAGDYLYGPVASTTLDGIVLDKGLEGKPSSGSTLFSNTLKWLSEPSIKGNVLGGAAMDVSLLKNLYKVQFAAPYNWNTPQNFPASPHWYKGVIGAQAKYNDSTGKWNIKDWVSAAKNNGLSYIVFLQPFTELTKETFDKLKKECKRYTSTNFAAIPGFIIKDEIGNHYFFYGSHTPYPEKKFLSSDGKVFISYDPQVGGNPYQKGQLAMTLLYYTYIQGGFEFISGHYLYSKSPIPFDNFYSDWDSTGVITTKNNHLIENSFPGYLQLVDFGQDPLPVAIDLMNNPKMLSKAQWFTLIDTPNITQYWDLWHFWPTASSVYITNGPKIESFDSIGPRGYVWTNNGNYVWQNYRWLLHGKVTSRLGLKEVKVYDGPKIFRKFLVGGKKKFQFTLDLTNDRQHYFVLVATDIYGRQAISRDLIDRNQKLELFQCSDRNNQLTFGRRIRKDGTWISVNGNGSCATPDKRLGSKQLNPAGNFYNDPRLGAPAFDGSASGDPTFFSPVICNSVKGQIKSPAVTDSLSLLADGNVQIGEGIWKWNFTDNINVYNVWHTLWKTQPAKEFTMTKTNYFFNMDPNSPIAVYLWNIHIKLLKDIPNNGFTIGFIEPSNSKTWAIKSGNALYSGKYNNKGKQKNITEPFNKGDYIAALNSPIGGMAIYPLTNGLQVSTTVPQKNYIYINLPKQDSPQKKGQTKTLNLLFIGIPRNTSLTKSFYPSPLNKVVKTFEQQFGLTSNGKIGYTLNIKHGKILSHRYILNIESGENKCFSGSISGNLISTLPIVVSNLNNRDSVYLYDRGLKKARPIGVFDGKAYATITLHGTRNLFIGAPVICDNPDLFVQVTQTGKDIWHLGINNPTNRVINAHVILNPYFDPFKGKSIESEITIKPGTSISKTI